MLTFGGMYLIRQIAVSLYFALMLFISGNYFSIEKSLEQAGYSDCSDYMTFVSGNSSPFVFIQEQNPNSGPSGGKVEIKTPAVFSIVVSDRFRRQLSSETFAYFLAPPYFVPCKYKIIYPFHEFG